jgi:hypothetical protein
MQMQAVEATGLLMQYRMNSTLVPADRIATSALVQAATARRLVWTHKLPAIVQMLKLLTASLVINVANMLVVLTPALRMRSRQERITSRSERDRFEDLGASK